MFWPGARAVTAAKRSPAIGSVIQTALVAPAMRATRAGAALSSRPTVTPSTPTGAPPTVTVQVEPLATAETARASGAARRTTTWSAPAVQRASVAGPRRAAPLMSRRPEVSKTIHTASPRRNTAAPTGVAQRKASDSFSGVASAVTGTV
jgi:hypothetical protein